MQDGDPPGQTEPPDIGRGPNGALRVRNMYENQSCSLPSGSTYSASVRSAIPFDTRRIAAQTRSGLTAYAAGLDQARDLADDVVVPETERLAALQELSAQTADPTLQKAFQAFQKSISTKRFANWSELILYCHFATAPVARQLQVMHGRAGDPPQIVIWPEGYCVAALILDLVLDCKQDYVLRDRVFLPADWLREAGADPQNLAAERVSPALRKVLERVLHRVEEMLRDARSGARRIADRRLRRAVLGGIANRRALVAKLRRRDPLGGTVALTALERLGCTLRGRIGR